MIPVFLISAKPLQYAVMRSDGKFYNFTTQMWDALPANGVPTKDNIQPMIPVAMVGPLVNQYIAQVPQMLSAWGGVAILTFTTDASGTLHQVDCINVVDLVDAPIRGGVSR